MTTGADLMSDGNVVTFDDNYSNDYETNDTMKIANGNENLASNDSVLTWLLKQDTRFSLKTLFIIASVICVPVIINSNLFPLT